MQTFLAPLTPSNLKSFCWHVEIVSRLEIQIGIIRIFSTRLGVTEGVGVVEGLT